MSSVASIKAVSQRAGSMGPDSGRRLRIAVLNRVFAPTGGGAERYSIALVEQLAARHEVHVFAQQIGHLWPGVTYHPVSAPLTKPRWLNQLWYATATWWATRRGFDVVHSHENTWHGQVQTVHVLPIKYNLFQGRSGWRLGLRRLGVFTSPRLLAYLVMEHFRFVTRQPRLVVATSPALQSIMGRVYPGCAVRVVQPGVTLPARGANRLMARQTLGLPVDARVLAFVANDYQKKGLATLLQALCLLPPDVVLGIVGNPAQADKFQQQARVLGVAERVYFLGALKDVAPLYESADVLAHPTTEDTFAMVVLEAMAHAVPVVVSDPSHCGIAGFLNHGENAWILASPTDERGLALALRRLLEDQPLHDRLAQASRAFAEQWTWSRIADLQERLYLEISGAVRPTAGDSN